jgi:hypothetical protein
VLFGFDEPFPEGVHHPRASVPGLLARGFQRRQFVLLRLAVGGGISRRCPHGPRRNLAARRVAEQLRQFHRRDQARLFFVSDDEGTEHEVVIHPRHRQTDVHPRTQLRCVDADLTRLPGGIIRG